MKNIVKRKVKRVFDRTIRYNTHYKPNGVYPTSKEYYELCKQEKAGYYELYPELVTSLTVQTDLFNNLSKYLIYDRVVNSGPEPVLIAKTTYFVVEIPNGRLYTNNIDTIAIIASNGHLIGDVSYQFIPNRATRPEENGTFKQNFFKKPVKYKGTVFNMLSGAGATNNYGHWLIDVLPRIHLLKESGLFDKVDWFLVPRYQIDYQIDSLRLLGIGPEKIIECTSDLHLEADYLIASTHPRSQYSFLIPDWVYTFLRHSFLSHQPDTSYYPPLVYISRRDSNIRQALNEPKLIALLTNYGFQTFTLASLPFIEKVRLFASAEVVIAVSGAGLANLFFCKPGTQVIEMFSRGMIQTAWYNIASKLGLSYRFLVSDQGSTATSEKQGQVEDVLVDLSSLKKMLTNLHALKK